MTPEFLNKNNIRGLFCVLLYESCLEGFQESNGFRMFLRMTPGFPSKTNHQWMLDDLLYEPLSDIFQESVIGIQQRNI